MAEFRADLHCHSTCSDGTETPEQLVRHALEIGLSGLSITDHDTVDAYKTALPLAKELGLRMISGVEFSTTHDTHNIHFLSYAFDLNHPAIFQLCERHKKRREERNRVILQKLRERRMPIEEDEIKDANSHTIGRPHIAQAMVSHGYVKTISDAFHTWIGDGKPCYYRGESVTTEETISIIHEAGGLAIIAHPHLVKDTGIIKRLLKLPFDGIECYYARFSTPQEKPWLEIAEKKGWIATGGSDFHGEVKPETLLGVSWVNEETFRILEEHGSARPSL